MNMVIEENNTLSTVHISDLKKHPQATVFNPMVTNLKDLREIWKVKVVDSPFV